MNINVNSKTTETQSANLLQLAEEMTLPAAGVAMAVDNKMVPRAEWGTTPLAEGANVIIIKAACGGQVFANCKWKIEN